MPIAGYLLQTCGYALALLSPACVLYALCCLARYCLPVSYGCICCSPYTTPRFLYLQPDAVQHAHGHRHAAHGGHHRGCAPDWLLVVGCKDTPGGGGDEHRAFAETHGAAQWLLS